MWGEGERGKLLLVEIGAGWGDVGLVFVVRARDALGGTEQAECCGDSRRRATD